MNKISIKENNSFGLSVFAQNVVFADSVQLLISAWQKAKNENQPVLILGEGTNSLFIEDFEGTIILNRIKGISIIEEENEWKIQANSGENWHNLVEFLVKKNIPGLQNLALIPGNVGSAPIQNIGAYGMEFAQICEFVEMINLQTGEISRIQNKDCKFGYRESIFKHEYKDNFAIISVGLILIKNTPFILNYGDLKSLDPKNTNIQQIFDKVCEIRRTKLPNPNVFGNAGSFFKNPVFSKNEGERLLKKYPNSPHFLQQNGDIKFAAGWFIEQANLKGFEIGDAQIHEKQALVIINKNQATSDDIINLAAFIRQKVGEKFGVFLEPEVRFIGKNGEKNAILILDERIKINETKNLSFN